MFLVFASLEIPDLRNLLAWYEVQDSSFREICQHLVDVLFLDAALSGHLALADELIVGEQSSVVAQECRDDAFLKG